MTGKPTPRYARVYLTDIPASCDKAYDYAIPERLSGAIAPGSFVVVPFGKGNRGAAALTVAVTDTTDVPPDKIKFIQDVMSPLLTLPEEYMGSGGAAGTLSGGLLKFLIHTTFCSPGEAIRAVLPASVMGDVREEWALNAEPSEPVGGEAEKVIAALKAGRQPPAAARDCLKRLEQSGYVMRRLVCRDAQAKTVERVALCVSREEAAAYIDGEHALRGEKQRALLSLLSGVSSASMEELRFQLKCDGIRAVAQRLENLGLVTIEEEEQIRDPYAGLSVGKAAESPLTDRQRQAADELIALTARETGGCALLYGVTGSGKTRVIREVMDAVLAKGGSVLYLVPEIGLTPQTVAFFKSFYGDTVAVYHSGLSDGERFDAWRRLRSGEARLCIGTRSAVFLPLRDLGLIVMDEEQERTYKSDTPPRYHARDVARFRCAAHGILLLLASATPSADSMLRTTEPGGSRAPYSLATLPARYAGGLPQVIIADTREDSRSGITGSIGSILRREIAENLSRGEQTILFLNRRGYHHLLRCPSCGTVKMCPSCSVAMTYHASGINAGALVCHYCGHRETPPPVCDVCGSSLSYQGTGTQRVEEELEELFPDASVLRMDADTTAAKFSADAILDDFREGKGDILLGTQMVAKGHDFPRVTLVGVIAADQSLYLDDYRANETTFSLLTQVVGRAGRAGNGGRAVIQTFSPDHPVIRLSAQQDYDAFMREELAFRRAFVFPPFCDFVSVTWSSADEALVSRTAAAAAFRLRREGPALQDGFTVYGPVEAPVYKLLDRYRLRVLMKCRLTRELRALIRSLLTPPADVTVSVDVNGNP